MLCLRNAKDLSRYGNLIQCVLKFRFEIVHIPSGKNLVSDYLTRMYDSTLFEDVEGYPDENLDMMHSGNFCSFWY